MSRFVQTPAAPLDTAAGTDDSQYSFDIWPTLAADGAGHWVAGWIEWNAGSGGGGGGGVAYVAHSDDDGQTWSLPAFLNNLARTNTGYDYAPQIATDGSGRWVAVWQSNHYLPQTLGNDSDILSAISTDNGESWTPPTPVNTNATSDTGNDREPHIGTDRQGNWLAVWESSGDFGQGLGDDDDIMVSRSTDGGATWSPARPVNDFAAIDNTSYSFDYQPRVTSDGLGGWIVVWFSTYDPETGLLGDTDVFVSRSADGGDTWSPSAPLSLDPNDGNADTSPALACDGSGLCLAAWSSGYGPETSLGTDSDILATRSDDGGVTWSPPFALNTTAVSDGPRDNDLDVKLAQDGHGGWLAAWQRTRPAEPRGGTPSIYDILAARSFDGGLTWSEPIVVHSLYVELAHISKLLPQVDASGQDRWLVAFTSEDDLGGTIGTDPDVLYVRLITAPTDCNSNGAPDACDIAEGVDVDCNSNGTPDQCDVAAGTSVDEIAPVVTAPTGISVDSDAGECNATFASMPSATADDNCAANPTISFVRSDDKPDLLDAYEAADSPITITWRAEDDWGNTATNTQVITVSQHNEVLVDIELSPALDPVGTVSRCIRFEAWQCVTDVVPRATVDAEVAFPATGAPPHRATNVSVLLPCDYYSCLTAVDRLHTLRSTAPSLVDAGAVYRATFVGNRATGGHWLVGGNLNGDTFIDIIDFGALSTRFQQFYGTGGTDCSTPFFHADIGGDGLVFTSDYAYLLVNVLKSHESNCCAAPGATADKPYATGGSGGPIMSISVSELWRRGMGELAGADLNGDGTLDAGDMAALARRNQSKDNAATGSRRAAR